MLTVLLFTYLFLHVASQSICEFGCIYFENILECSNIKLTKLPEFTEVCKIINTKVDVEEHG